MRQFQCVPTPYVFSINEIFNIRFSKTNSQPLSFIQRNEQVEINNFSCSLPCIWKTIIDFYFMSWDVPWEYIATLLYCNIAIYVVVL